MIYIYFLTLFLHQHFQVFCLALSYQQNFFWNKNINKNLSFACSFTVNAILYSFRSYDIVKMGRARNHGGTGGHGYFPLPGEKPDYNRHVINDKTLTSLLSKSKGLKTSNKEEVNVTAESTKVNIMTQVDQKTLHVKNIKERVKMVCLIFFPVLDVPKIDATM